MLNGGVIDMPWCPKCRIEYSEGFDTCSDCNEKLVEKLEGMPEDNESKVMDEPLQMEPEDHEAFLTSVGDSIEAEIVEGLLNSNGIPVLKKYSDAGGYFTVYAGGTFLGVDLYVPSKLLDKARELLESMSGENLTENDEAGDSSGEASDMLSDETCCELNDETGGELGNELGNEEQIEQGNQENDKRENENKGKENELDAAGVNRYNNRKKITILLLVILAVTIIIFILDMIRNI